MDNNPKPMSAILSIFTKLSIQQRFFIGGVFVAIIVLLAFVFLIVNEPTYVTLYANINPDDATKVIEYLDSEKVPYKIDAGQTISIPSNKLYQVRLALAGKGIPSSGIIGYEIFDNSTMGMSEFMQKVNYKRALEGEIAKTIMQLRGVSNARVNIVIPEKSIFKEEQKEPTASVALTLGNTILSSNNIAAITNLVSSSVEGLRPEKVTIIDSNGRLLTKQYEEEGLSVSSSKQYEIRGKVETYLAKKAQGILDKVVGYGNSDVKVNVDIDFTKAEKTMTTFDPESQVAISENSVKTTNSGVSRIDSNLVSSENSTTNYELSKTIETVISGSGSIKRVTVAVVVNGIPEESTDASGKKTTLIKPRPKEQLQQIEQLIRQSVGIDEQRNDRISVVSIPFENQFEKPEVIEEAPLGDINKIMNIVFAIVGLMAAMFILKQLMSKLRNEPILIGPVSPGMSASLYEDQAMPEFMPTPGQTIASPPMPNASLNNAMQQQVAKKRREMIQVGDIEDEITDEAVRKKMEQEKIVNYVSKNPQDAAKLINSWLREDEY